jgi:hypothetical protein
MSEENAGTEPTHAAQAPPTGDTTLGGYLHTHSRPPAFEGSDEYPYTVSIETERTGNLRTPVTGFLVFPRWAQSGVGIVGHLESPTLVECDTVELATAELKSMTLSEVKALLEAAIHVGAEDQDDD